jgi:hypothetical protein
MNRPASTRTSLHFFRDSSTVLTVEDSVHSLSSALSIGDSIKRSQISAVKSSLAKSLLASDRLQRQHGVHPVKTSKRKSSVRTSVRTHVGGMNDSQSVGSAAGFFGPGSAKSPLLSPQLEMTDSPASELVEPEPILQQQRQVSIPSKRTSARPFQDHLLLSTRMTPVSRRNSPLLDASSIGSLTSSLGSGSVGGGSPVGGAKKAARSLHVRKISLQPPSPK